MESKNKFIVIGVIVVIAVAAVVYVAWDDGGLMLRTPSGGEVTTSSPFVFSTTTDELLGASSTELLPLSDSDAEKKETPADTVVTKEVEADELRIYTISADGSKFTPNEIVVDKGDRIQINVVAVGGTRSFVISEPLSLRFEVKEERPITFGFDATQEGRYQFSDIEGKVKGVIIVR